MGEKGLGTLGRIISFNVGVELGQIAALLVMLLVLSRWRKQSGFQRFSRIANDGIIALGVLLFVMQMHGYMHGRYADDFGFNADGHAHAHEDMKPAVPEVPHDNL